MATLVVVIDGKPTEYQLTGEPMSIGRHPDCTIAINEPSVSGRHANIQGADGVFVIEDAGSRNGTFVNDQRIEGRADLHHGDAIRFGNTAAHFHDPASRPATDDSPVLADRAGAGEPVPFFGSGPGQVNIDEADEPTITDKLSTAGRFGILEVNPEAKLKAVLEISNNLAGTVDLTALLPKILDSLFGIFRCADRGCILLKDDTTGELVPRAMRHRRKDEDSTVRLSRTIIQRVLTEKSGVLSADATVDSAFSTSQSIADINIRSMMCVPLLRSDGQVLGILSIDSQNTLGQFTHDDLDILMTVAGQAALAYENAQLVQIYAEKRKQDAEMDIAKSVQRALLPTEMPEVEGYQFYASYDSARAVGGDMYDWFELPDGKICLSFGDVAGKGVPGALIMSRMDSCVQSTIRHVHDAVEAVCAINEHMCDSEVEGRFVTYILCIVDTNSHEVVLVNAGHMPPIIRRADGTIEKFDEELSGPPICVVDDYPYEAQTCKLEPGDLIVMYTDGVDEAMNSEGELYGAQRLLDFVKNGPLEAEQMGKLLLEDVRRHAQGHPQSDDITIMTFGRNS
jgi:serine phosphatase RsbU (regulator of sigma subunit)/pSer/pThr/pTyr-binding forkhead associated (FHA) protein